MISWKSRIALFILFTLALAGRPGASAAEPSADERYKADILLVIGHPDDETFIAGYLARAAFDQHKRIAVIICTMSEAGGNVHGPESGLALGYVQVVEGKRAFSSLGIENVWFVSGRDTPGQNVLWSLGNWGHGRVLGEVTRLVRLTRPEVILTSLPLPVVGENHGDHQAAGVIATEAFDSAADPTVFPEQVAAAHDLRGVGNLTEGLRPWQAKKLYFFSDAFDYHSQYWDDPKDASPFRPNFLVGAGPEYSTTEVSPAKGVSYARLTAVESSFYLSQSGIGDRATAALAKNDFHEYTHPVRLIFGKSLVGSASPTAEVFEGITGAEVAYTPAAGFRPSSAPNLRLQLGGPWEFYAQFWSAHELSSVAHLLPVPELALGNGAALALPLTIENTSGSDADVVVKAELPAGWSEPDTPGPQRIRSGGTIRLQTLLIAPMLSQPQWQELRWRAYSNGKPVGEILLRVLAGKDGGLPQ
ncbi:MAG: PIG-L family deacetylase [Acidobacteria bacterium]|nr:PIG-L family deacetylase [Acidobacteriota bacterium]